MNMTIVKWARSMRLHVELPKYFWVDVVSTIAYLINKRPLVPLNGGLPKEAWTGKEISLPHL